MAKLNQIVAVANGVKSRAQASLTDLYKRLQNAGPMTGIARVYQPLNDLGEKKPPESRNVQFKVADAFLEAETVWSNLIDTVGEQDLANTTAAADLVVDGVVVIPQVPITTLLFFEHVLKDLMAFVNHIPTLDAAYDWHYNELLGVWDTKPVQSLSTAKVRVNHVKYPATEQHAAQVEVFTEDVTVGTWTTVNSSGAIPATQKKELVLRVLALQDAVKKAREAANMAETRKVDYAKHLFSYLLGKGN
jgi:hypothetical protein